MTRSKPLWSLSQPAHSVRVSCEGNLVADEAPAHSLRYDCPFGGLIEQVFGLSGNGKLARIELMRSAHSNCAGSQVALALLWICDRFPFAYSDPETGPPNCRPEKDPRNSVIELCTSHSSVRFGAENSQNGGHFRHFLGKTPNGSQLFRLRGGGRGIRTLGPALAR